MEPLLIAMFGVALIPFASGIWVGKPLLGMVFAVVLFMYLGFRSQQPFVLGLSIVLFMLVAFIIAKDYVDLALGGGGAGG